MEDPLEILSILAPNCIDLRHIPGGFTRLTQHDIAAKLAKCSPAASCLGRVKIAGQWDLLPDLERWVMVKTPIRIPEPMFRPMVKQAVLEVLDPKNCRTCKGRGWMPIHDRIVPCEACEGGKYRYSEQSRARGCQVPWTSWRRHWSGPYKVVLKTSWDIEAELRDSFR